MAGIFRLTWLNVGAKIPPVLGLLKMRLCSQVKIWPAYRKSLPKKELKLFGGDYLPSEVRRVINNIATQYEQRMIIFAETQGSFPFFAQTHGKAQSVFLLRPRFKTHKLGVVE